MTAILLAANISTTFRNFLAQHYDLLLDISEIEDIEPEQFVLVRGIITSNKINLDAFTLTKFPTLKWIGRLGSGMEIIDAHFCQQHQIHCFSSPKGIANSVAEHAVGMLLCLRHHIVSSYEEIKNKQWIREPNRGMELESLTLGIIGYGNTGRAFASKMKPFVKSIIAYDKYKTNFGDKVVQEVSLEQLKEQATIISMHIPLTNETTYLYNTNFIESVHNKHILINTSRGKNAKTNDILEGLQSGKIIGACLDVLEEEKNIQDVLKQDQNQIQKLLNYPVIITPHIAGYSHDAIEKMSDELQKQIEPIL